MMRWGERLRVTVSGSSHGPNVAVAIDGLPQGTPVSESGIQADLDRRKPVGRRLATKRAEDDRVVIEAGVRDGAGDGTTFRARIDNLDVRREPYDRLRDTPRPGHADYPARVRYGEGADLSGGGIFSGRMTAPLVIAGAVARGLLEPRGIRAVGFTRSIGTVEADVPEDLGVDELARRALDNEVGTPDRTAAARMEETISAARRDGDSVGGVVEVRTVGVPTGLGEPFFDSLESVLAHLAFSVPAVKGIEFGAGFGATRLRGSQHNDPFEWRDGRVVTSTNHAGGILGGLATGMPIVFRAAVKPTSSIARRQRTVNLVTRAPVELVVTGRHDPCIVPRAVVVLEAVARIAIADLGLRGGFLP